MQAALKAPSHPITTPAPTGNLAAVTF